jgi:CheY-like chemotaxis protein
LRKEAGVPVNILVADDSVTMRRILELTFQGEDARVTTVDGADAAIRKASEITPDVVFADLSMSGMDGYALAAAIKSQPGLERTAVVVMASQKIPYDDDRGKAAGVDDHIMKPFDSQLVIDRVKQLLGKPRVAPAAGARPAAAAAAPSAATMDAGRQSRVGNKTIAFGKPPTPGMPTPAMPPAGPSKPQGLPAPHPSIAQPVASKPAAAVAAVATASAGAELEQKLSGMGLSPDQVAGVIALSREVVEKVVWEIVPDLAETIIKEEIRRLTAS